MGCNAGKASAPKVGGKPVATENTLLESRSSTKSSGTDLQLPSSAGSRNVPHAETTAPSRFQPNSTLQRDNATEVFEIGAQVATVFGFKGVITFGPDTNNYYIVTCGDENRFVGASSIKKAAIPDAFQVGDLVIVIKDFASDGSSRTPLKRGLKGVVSDYHEGDAYIKFGGSEQLRVLGKNLHNLEKIKAGAQPKVALATQPELRSPRTEISVDQTRRVMNPKSPRTDETLEKTRHEADSGGAFTCVAFTPKDTPVVLAPTSRRQRQCCCA